MRIGIMLRHLGQHGGGVLVYTRAIVDHLSRIGAGHEFVLMYADPRFVGEYGDRDNVEEVVVEGRSRLGWDQLAVPRFAQRAGLDVIFNPKYSVPLATTIPSVFVCHGLDWYLMPEGSRWRDRLSHRFLVPRYAAKAAGIIAVSNTARDHAMEYLSVPRDRVRTVYLGIDDRFRARPDDASVEEVRRSRHLPERFFLFCGQIYPPKNFGRLLRAYARVGPENGISLVVAGEHTWLCEREIALIDELGLRPWVIRAGWVDREALPSFYHLALALLLPSLYEACPSPILEAMASGCPIVTSNRYGTVELAGDAAVLVDPEEVDGIAQGMRRVIEDAALRKSLVAAGRDRADRFSWEACASGTLAAIEEAAAAPLRVPG